MSVFKKNKPKFNLDLSPFFSRSCGESSRKHAQFYCVNRLPKSIPAMLLLRYEVLALQVGKDAEG